MDGRRRPFVDEERPAVRRQWLSANEKRALDRRKRSFFHRKTFADTDRSSDAEYEWAFVDGKRSGAGEPCPVVQGKRAAAEEEWPISEEQRFAAEEDRVVPDEQRSGADDKRPATEEERPDVE
jgi:hypothetical protein